LFEISLLYTYICSDKTKRRVPVGVDSTEVIDCPKLKKSREEIAESSLVIEREKADAQIQSLQKIPIAVSSIGQYFQTMEVKARLEIAKMLKDHPDLEPVTLQ